MVLGLRFGAAAATFGAGAGAPAPKVAPSAGYEPDDCYKINIKTNFVIE